MYKKIAIAMFAAALLAGCSSAKETVGEEGYKLEASVVQRAEQYVLDVDTNLNLSADKYAQSHHEGEGHIHFYMNGRLIGPLLNNGPTAISLTLLQKGENTVKLVLAGNNHAEDAYKLTKEVTFTVN
jgi:PBP1b-binding outer membrane lipoprotein LpoB